ncbi:Gfo/Idh/MocA family protein [Zunongwangia sp. HRR-M8]|uniref:Gfo/Idh/MocA family protein n=1 Tax=Zunongwangia sp. HRR-M8 TaxID=3015170 RepID=UPI0022DD03F1|nr:Gfo/Idh/MocA family oxidoreductase [Zunongwangia sp. HRR-M8]WBL23362.1 Gfo/Idh/MocA family oxidoreductase [Zunongwangia sp. HRR-M8]
MSTENKKLRLGILGLGEGRSTISAALSSPKIELVKMCDLNLEVCKKRAKEFDFYEYTTKFEDLLDDPTIEAIAIYTPDHLHATHIKLALEHDKHVVCTKPLIDDLKDASELVKLQEKTGKKLFVGQSSRFFQPMKRQRQDFENGLIGDLVTVEAYYNADHRWFLKKTWALENSFKWLYGGLSHPVDFIRWYLPEIEEVMGYGMLSENGKNGGLKNYDTMQFIYKSKDGRIARVGGAYSGPVQPVQRDSEMSCILRGNLGCSQGDYMDLRYAITDKDGEERIITWEHKLKHFFRFEGKSHHAGEYENYLNYFADSIHQDFTAYPDLIEGIGTIVLLKAMERSLGSGKPEKISAIIEEFNLQKLLS